MTNVTYPITSTTADFLCPLGFSVSEGYNMVPFIHSVASSSVRGRAVIYRSPYEIRVLPCSSSRTSDRIFMKFGTDAGIDLKHERIFFGISDIGELPFPVISESVYL